MPTSPQDLYARLLLSSHPGYGYPLWTPEPSHELLMQRERGDGLKIGDVGVVKPENGGFDVLFNICLPRNHEFHRRRGVPEGFTFIDPNELDIQTCTNAVNSGRTISTPSVKSVGMAEPSVNDAPQRGGLVDLAYRFALSSTEGALLILPSGAKEYDLLNEGLFIEQASQHGAEWYNYAVNRRHRVINHDSLYLITGFYKAHCWSVAAFESIMENEHHTARFKRVQGHGPGPAYSWETTRALDWRAGPDIEDGHANQAVFISGLKIALRTGILGSRRITVEADYPSTRPIHGKLSSIMPNNSRLLDSFSRSFKMDGGRSVSQTTAHNQGTADSPEGQPPQDASSRDVYDGMHVEIRRVPDVPAVFHPSDAINQYLFRKEPSANIAITHDSVWMAILQEELLRVEEFERESRLEEVLSHHYHIISEEGVVRLERKSDPDALDDNELERERQTKGTVEDADKRRLGNSRGPRWQHTVDSMQRCLTRAGPGGDLSPSIPTPLLVEWVKLASPSGSFSAGGSFTNAKACSSSGQQGSNVAGESVGTNNFVTKLYHMINDAKSQNFVTWTDIGSSFVVCNVGEFSRSILGAHFKHNNFSSFVRQLNMYGFHKINRTPRGQRTSSTSQTWEFSHPKFLRGRPDLLKAIKRKALEPDPRERSRVELPGEVARLLSELREENRTLWREIKSLSNRVPQPLPTANHGPATMSQNVGGSTQGSQGHISHNVALGGGHVLTHSRSSSNLEGDDADVDWEDEDGMSASALTGIGVGGSQGGEEWDAQSPSFNFGAGTGLNAYGFTFNALVSSEDEWKRWAEGEISKERKRVEKLVGIVKALVDVAGKSDISGAPLNMSMDREHHPIPLSILQELHELFLTFDNSSSPVPMPIPSPSPSPSPSPHPWTRPHSPNIYITSPMLPTPYGGSSHSRSPSRDSPTHSNPNSHASPPTLAIPDPVTACSSPLSSPTTSDFIPSFVSQGLGHARSRSQLGPRIPRQPDITFTPDSDDGRAEKRARTDKVQDGLEGLRMGDEMDIVPSEVGEDVKLSSTLPLTGGTSTMTNPGVDVDPGAGGMKMGLRSRSDSASMWGAGGSFVQGGLSANWMGLGRSGSSFGQ